MFFAPLYNTMMQGVAWVLGALFITMLTGCTLVPTPSQPLPPPHRFTTIPTVGPEYHAGLLVADVSSVMERGNKFLIRGSLLNNSGKDIAAASGKVVFLDGTTMSGSDPI